MKSIQTTVNDFDVLIQDFVSKMSGDNVTSGYIVANKGETLTGSNNVSAELIQTIHHNSNFANHEAVFFKIDQETNCLFIVFVHSTVRGQAQGGTRLLYYQTLNEVITDGLRLSSAMTDKNATAGLWWGGGKAIICPLDAETFNLINTRGKSDGKEAKNLDREKVFINYGKYIASLNGVYIAAEDMNTTPDDMLTILSVCRYVTCLPPKVGGSSNPSVWTARGVFQAMLATVHHFEDQKNLEGKTIGIQGVGNVGMPLAKMILDNGGKIIVYDPNQEACKTIAAYSDKVTILNNPDEIYSTEIDIFSPCARGGILNQETISLLKCRYIIGAANNQLDKSDSDSILLEEKNIIYLPDFFINRMGIINCANEQYGRLESDLNIEVEKVYFDTNRLLDQSEFLKKSPHVVAINWAKEKGGIPHPIWGHRGVGLIEDYMLKFKPSKE